MIPDTTPSRTRYITIDDGDDDDDDWDYESRTTGDGVPLISSLVPGLLHRTGLAVGTGRALFSNVAHAFINSSYIFSLAVLVGRPRRLSSMGTVHPVIVIQCKRDEWTDRSVEGHNVPT